MQLTGLENRVRLCVYQHFVEEGRAPSRAEVTAALAISPNQACETFESLAEKHVVALDAQDREIWMAMPFSAVPTPYRVTSGHSSWWGNCAWDALGIPAMLHEDATIDSRCPVSGQELELRVIAGQPAADPAGFVHFAVAAARWWEDIGYT
jgi:hypothetical protein